MKKILLSLLIALLGSLGFALLSPGVSAEEGDGVVRIWFSQYTAENEAMETIAEAFTQATGIAVEVVPRMTVFTAAQDFVNNVQNDERPDIVFMQAPDIGNLVKSGLLYPLDEFVDDDLRDRYADSALSAFTLEGVPYGIGYSIDTYGLVYNKALISEEELPATWEEFFEKGEALTERDGDGNIVQWGICLNTKDMWFNYPIIRAYGGYYYGTYPNGDYNPYDVGLDNDGMLDYVAKMKELKASGLTLSTSTQTESTFVARFIAGKLAMMIYGLWNAAMFQDAGIDYGIASLPDPGDGSTSLALTTVQGFVVNRYSDDLESTLSFLEFMLQDDNQQLLIEAADGGAEKLGTRNPANLSVMESDYIQSDTILSSLAALNSECEPFPNIPEGTIWYNYTTTCFQAIFFGTTGGDEVDPAAKLRELADTIRGDVAEMNEEPERIEIPSYVGILLILTGIALLATWILVARSRRRKSAHPKRYGKRETVLAWALMIPLLGLLGLFYVYPILQNCYLSLTDYSGIHLLDYGLIGWANYRTIFSTGLADLGSMTLWTVFFAASVVLLSFLLGTLLSTVLNRTGDRIAKIYRLVFILPWVVPAVITLLMWQGLLDTEDGLVNHALGLLGLPAIPWLSDPSLARVSTILVMVWFSFPYFMVVSTGLIKGIPKDYYEAAKVDGANGFYLFFRITLPLVFRALIPTLIMSFLLQFNQFGVYILTAGGPASDVIGAPGATDLLITYVFNTAFNTNRFGLAAAYSVIIFLFVALFSILAMKAGKKLSEGEQ